MLPRLYTVDEVIENVFAGRRDRRSLIENLRDGGKFAGCARKDGQAWVFTDDDIRALLDRMKPAPVDYGPTAPRGSGIRRRTRKP